MTARRRAQSLLVIPLLALAAACGPGLVSPDSHKGPPLAVLGADVTGALEGELPADAVRGALLWSAYDPALLSCLEQVPAFEVPLDPYNDPADEEVAYQLSLCLTLHLQSTVESDSVPLEPTFPASFDIPLYALPDPSLLTGAPGAQMGLAAVSVYVDGNANGHLDLVAPGTFESADTVIGSSAAVEEEDLVHALVVFREGALSPLWTLFRAVYDCPDSIPEGFSVVTITISDDQSSVTCAVGDGPIPVRLSESDAMRREVCLPQPEQGVFVEATAADSIPGGAAILCEDGVAYYSTSADAICPLIGHYDLYGCRDTSSEAACRASFFDHTADPPAWWPCNSFGQPAFFFPHEAFATDGLDTLGTVSPRGTAMFELADLSLELQAPGGGTFTLGADAFELVDNDGNGWANQGDSIVVTETDNVFDPQSPPGTYEVRVLLYGEEVSQSGYAPVEIPQTELPRHILEVLDAPGPDAVGDPIAVGTLLFTLRSVAGQGSYPLADLRLVIALFGKAYETMPDDMMTLVDHDGDGEFGAGDAIEVRMSASVSEWGAPQLHDQNGNLVFLEVRTGVNVYTSITGGEYGSTTWGRFTIRMETLETPLTDGLDAIAQLFVINAEPFSLQGIGGYWSVTAFNGDSVLSTELSASFFTHSDIDGDGLVSRGDVLTLQEVDPVLDASHADPDVYQSLYLASPDGSTASTWSTLR